MAIFHGKNNQQYIKSELINTFRKHLGKSNSQVFRNTVIGYYHQHIHCVPSFFLFSNLYLFLGGKHKLFTRQIKVEIGKSTCINKNRSKNAESGGEKTPFPSISSLIGRVLSIFRQKTDGSIPSEKDIKALIPAPTNCLQAE